MARLDFYSTEMLGGAPAAMASDALYELGLMYCSGRNGDYDLVEAHKWFNRGDRRDLARAEAGSRMADAALSRHAFAEPTRILIRSLNMRAFAYDDLPLEGAASGGVSIS